MPTIIDEGDGGASAAGSDAAAFARNLVASGSIEIGAGRPQDVEAIAGLLPQGVPVYVHHMPRHGLDATLAACRLVHEAGFEPVPHIAARRVAGKGEVAKFLASAVADAGIRRLLLIGGDAPGAVGPYRDVLGLLEDGVVAENGIREVGLAGYSEGHPSIPQTQLIEALDAKVASVRRQQLAVFVVTQFSFVPKRIVEYCCELEARLPGVPVFIGTAGPASTLELLKFARRCGVSASLRALKAQGMGALRLLAHTDPGEQLTAIARHAIASRAENIAGAHFFSFGGVERTARWMKSRRATT